MSPAIQEVIKTLHLNADDVPYVGREESRYRLLHARPSENLVVTQLWGQPGFRSGLHRHLAPVYGITTVGTWGHDTTYEYRPGSYIFETPGAPHRFYNGPDETNIYFVSTGILEWLDPETGEVTGMNSITDQVKEYFAACEAAGLPRPNILE